MKGAAFALMLGAAVMLVPGCSRGNSEATSSVSGVVTMADTPLQQGSVMFISAEGKSASAQIQSDGKYELKCPPMKYQVAVVPPPPRDPLASGGSDTSLNPPKIPRMYQDVGTSPLVVEVTSGTNEYDIRLEKGK